MRFSDRTKHIDISGIRRMFELAKGRDSINLGLGEPDFPIPERSKEAIAAALKNDQTHYTPGKGIIELRRAISNSLSRKHIDADPDDIIVTSGASEALAISLLSIVDPGDEVLIPDPGFVSYAPLTRIAGGLPVPYSLRANDGFETRAEEIEKRITKGTKAIILNSPSNPTGAVTDKSQIKAVAELAADHDIAVISDEVYDQIIYDGSHTSIARYMDKAIIVNSFSKTYSMTGLRLGYLHAPSEAVEEILKIHQYLQASTSSLSQAAALSALSEDGGYVRNLVIALKKRRDLAISMTREIKGLKCTIPSGAFYLFPDVSFCGKPSKELALEILGEARVIVTPGRAFGKNGEGHIRIAYATSEDNIVEGMQRLKDCLSSFSKSKR